MPVPHVCQRAWQSTNTTDHLVSIVVTLISHARRHTANDVGTCTRKVASAPLAGEWRRAVRRARSGGCAARGEKAREARSRWMGSHPPWLPSAAET